MKQFGLEARAIILAQLALDLANVIAGPRQAIYHVRCEPVANP